jgi:Putative transposase of IS4/5 family (DUF4096)
MAALAVGRLGRMSRTKLLSDEMWARIEPLLPDRAPRRGGRWGDHHRAVVEAVCCRFRTGSPWRDLPPGFLRGKRFGGVLTGGPRTAPGIGSSPRCRSMRTPRASWSGWCRSIPPSPGLISTRRARPCHNPRPGRHGIQLSRSRAKRSGSSPRRGRGTGCEDRGRADRQPVGIGRRTPDHVERGWLIS